MTVQAIDNDRGENGRVSYFLKVGDQNVDETEEFLLNTETGELRTKVVLDREKTPFYKVSIFQRQARSSLLRESKLMRRYLLTANLSSQRQRKTNFLRNSEFINDSTERRR